MSNEIQNTTAQVSNTTNERESKLKGLTNDKVREMFKTSKEFADGNLMIVEMDKGSRYNQIMEDGTRNTSINILVAMQADADFGAALSGADLDLTYVGYRDGTIYRHIVPMPEDVVNASGYKVGGKFEIVRGTRKLPVTLVISDKFEPQEGRINHEPLRAPIVPNPDRDNPEHWIELTVEGNKVYRHTELKAQAYINTNPDKQFQIFTEFDQSKLLSELRTSQREEATNTTESKNPDVSTD